MLKSSAILNLSGALLLAGAIRTDANGAKIQRFSKDLIRAGDWVKASTDQRFKIDAEWMAGRVAEFGRMKAAGVRVPVPVGHTNDPEANRGYLEELWVDGDTLMGAIDLIGDKAIALASTCEVSIYVPEKITDGKGNEYVQPIEHVALVTDPVISGQKKFIPIAASRGGPTVKVPVCRLSKGDSTMKWQDLCAALGLSTEGLDDTSGPAAVLKKLEELTSQNKNLSKEAADAKTALAASRNKPEPDPVVLRLARENREMKLDRLVEAGKITPAVRAKLAGCFIGENDANLKLSLDADGDGRFCAMVEALGENDPVKLKEQTASQSFALNRQTPGDGKSDADIAEQARKDAEARNKQLA